MINRLYSLLIAGIENPGPAEYQKKTSDVWMSERGTAIKQALLKNTPNDKVLLFAEILCQEVLHTQFGEEILELDPNNTYAYNITTCSTLSDTVIPAAQLSLMKTELDADIYNRLTNPNWIDLVAAGCLQMLRDSF